MKTLPTHTGPFKCYLSYHGSWPSLLLRVVNEVSLTKTRRALSSRGERVGAILEKRDLWLPRGPSGKALLGYDEGGFLGRGSSWLTALIVGCSIQQEMGFTNTIQRENRGWKEAGAPTSRSSTF